MTETLVSVLAVTGFRLVWILMPVIAYLSASSIFGFGLQPTRAR